MPALYACVRLLADSTASLPLKIYTKAGANGRGVPYEGPSIFDEPSADGTIYDWLFQCMTSLLLHGNAWGLITGRDGYGYPTGIEWLPPDMVQVVDDERQPYNPMRTRVYVYGRQMNNWREELFHVKAFSLAGRTEGISPLRAFALTILNGMEAAKYGLDWFQSGGFPPGTFQNNEIEIDATAAAEIRESLTTAIQNKQPLVYGRDWDYKPVVVPPGEAQFITAMQLNAGQIAAVYGLPAERVGGIKTDSITYSNVEMSALQIIEALRPWLVRLETAFFALLPQNRYTRFYTDALLKTDLASRANIYKIFREVGIRTVDELRELEDLEPMPKGVGTEAIPHDIMVQLVRAGVVQAVPTSLLPALTLDTDLLVPVLEKLQAQGLAAAPLAGKPPVGESPAGQVGMSIDKLRSTGDISSADVDAMVEIFRKASRKQRQREQQAGGPEFIGPWIPSEDELARLTAANGNGNGRHH